MTKGRVEAFSDGVLAIIITVMVLEFKVPHSATVGELKTLLPTFLSYVLSFVFVAIYWNNHHHLFQVARRVNVAVLWANSHLLFWLSLIPFATNWMGESGFAALPVGVYGVLLLLCGTAFQVMTATVVRAQGLGSELEIKLGKNVKGTVSLVMYGLAVAFAWFSPLVSLALYATVACVWLVPDRRLESEIDAGQAHRE